MTFPEPTDFQMARAHDCAENLIKDIQDAILYALGRAGLRDVLREDPGLLRRIRDAVSTAYRQGYQDAWGEAVMRQAAASQAMADRVLVAALENASRPEGERATAILLAMGPGAETPAYTPMDPERGGAILDRWTLQSEVPGEGGYYAQTWYRDDGAVLYYDTGLRNGWYDLGSGRFKLDSPTRDAAMAAVPDKP